MLALLPVVVRTQHNRELLRLLTWRETVARYKRTVLGVGWALAEPLSLGAVYFVVFRYFAHVQVDNYPFYLMAGLFPWICLQGCIMHSAGAIGDNSNLVKKVYFPRAALSLSRVLNQFLNLAVCMGLLLAVALPWPNLGWGLHTLWLVPGCTLLFALSAALGAAVSVLTPYLRDLTHILGFVFRLGTYASPIMYETSNVPGAWRFVLLVNPMTCVLEMFHAALLPNRGLDWHAVVVSAGVLAVLTILGCLAFVRVDRHVAELL